MSFILVLCPVLVSADVTVSWNDGTETVLKYTDINEGAWYIEPVAIMQDLGIMTGTSEIAFEPVAPVYRAQFATILWRIAGEPDDVTYEEGTFSDIKENSLTSWYTTAVAWVSEHGIMIGYADGSNRFDPNAPITREQMITTLFRFVEAYNFDNGLRDELIQFPDDRAVSDFAGEAMKWSVANGIIQGDQGYINPQGYTERVQCAKVLTVFLLSLDAPE